MSRSSTRSPQRRAPHLPPGLGYTPRASSPKTRTPPSSSPKTAAADTARGLLPCMVYVVAYHLAFAGGLVAWHASKHGIVSPVHASLSVFLATNAWICVCEISLLCYPEHIQREYAGFAARYGPHTLAPVFLFRGVRLRDALGLKYWSVMWSTYSSLDASYVDTGSFGYCVDVCNGVSTLLPTLVYALGMTTHTLLSPRLLGMLGLVSFYQEAYGTVVYFFQFFFNGRHKKAPRSHVLGIVVPANFIWIAFPALGMWASARLILDGTFAVFLGA